MSDITTVRGSISSGDLGLTLVHEHVFIDLRSRLARATEASKVAIQESPVSMEILGALHRDVFVNEDNLLLSDLDLAISEISKYKMRGGKSVVEVTVPGIGRDPVALRAVSEAADINIICGTGWYEYFTHPAIVRNNTVDKLAEMMVRELEKGIGDSGIRAGIIGEIGLGFPIHPDEDKVLQAAVKAHKETKAAINIHPPLFDLENQIVPKEGNKIVDMVESMGADLGKIILAHSDIALDLDYHRSLLDRGIIVEYDTFGMESYVDSIYIGQQGISDWQRVNALGELCKQGYEKQLMMSHDTCFKMLLTRYGGYGYAHILEHIVPMLRRTGVSDKQIDTMMIDNPRRILPF